MGTIKVRNDKDLTEVEDIKKQWQEHIEIYKKELHDLINNGVVSHLELDIRQCEVKWALGSITTNKASGDDGVSAELFKILKDNAVKGLHSTCQQIWKTQQWPQDGKGQFSFQSQRRVMPKKFQTTIPKIKKKIFFNYRTIELISHASKILLKILKGMLQQYMN